MPPRLPRVLLLAPLAAAALTSGCGGGGGGGGAATTAAGTQRTATTAPGAPATTTTTTTPAAPPAGAGALPGASTTAVVGRATTSQTALLTGVRAAHHDGYDRVVFEFRNALPGYDVRYVPRPVRQDASGTAVEVQGGYVARVRMEQAADADLDQPGAPMTYTGPPRLSPGLPEILEVARIGGFEAVLTWAVGVRDRAPFRVSTLQAPARLVVDFRSR